VALVAERTGLDAPVGWEDSYRPALRTDVDRAIDLEWKEARWDEQILRSQMLRLLWRAR